MAACNRFMWNWVIGVVLETAVMLMRGWLKHEDDKPALPEAVWATRENMLAPGFDKKGYGRTRFGSPRLKE